MMSERARVEAAWSRFETWLSQHAPRSYGLLRPAAAPGRIEEAERALEVRFPPELRALYSLHDGVRGVDLNEFGEQPLLPSGEDDPWHRQANAVDFMPNGQAWLPLEHVVSTHASPLSEYAGDESVRYVPVTASALHTMMYGTYLDLDTGMLGMWSDASELEPLGVGLAEWLEDGADALVEARPTRTMGMLPYLSPTGDGLGWFDPDPMYEQDGWRPLGS
ncbi:MULTISPECIES: SMI1/KNR4 family protein [Streptomyces]|uniref:SMI1/KNR4 family protein n=1 Tax=Streptomyces sudanensis TaxID=436397 RepID=A0ABY4TCF3_9ACTN|nr:MULTISPECIES: SMI1/KNR4 family protein [Streptomyces]URN15905.1 SMI1/KNR4 family protein [Streptomyces sudanensis]